ncbi:MAG TPA: NADH-quinone oxidoreductase subunit N [Cytophagales bacterium]|jgi:NADH-quinone oxidoreductase subunit N|nr:NADH-quinone oxidoreductase subunit N [Cytophagales bacterium]
MSWDSIFVMRHEVLLLILILFQLVADLYRGSGKSSHINFTIVFFVLIMISGFVPSTDARLFGSMYVSDPLRDLLKNFLNLFVLITLLQSARWLRKEEHQLSEGAFYLLLFSSLLGMYFMISAGDFLMFYLGLELSAIPMTLLAAFDKQLKRSAEAGIKLLMSSAVSSAMLLFGLSIIYGVYGTFHFIEIAVQSNVSALSSFGLLFFISGLGFKLSLVPFHLWTADVYEGAPLPVTTFLSVASKGTALFTMMLLLFNVFGAQTKTWSLALYFLSIVTMVIGVLFAIRQKNMKRFLAFSSITQVGFMMLGFMSGSVLAENSIIYFMLIYGLSNLAVFGVLSIVSNATGKETIADLNGFYLTNPRLSLIMLLALFSLAGIPPLSGFFGKLFLFMAVASKGMYGLLILAVFNAVISLYYYLLIVKAMFIDKSEAPIPSLTSTMYEKLSFSICLIGILIFGFSNSIFDFIRSVL